MPNDLVHRTSTLKFINFLCIGYLQDRQCQQKVQELQKLLEVAESCHKQEIKVLRETYEKKMGESNLRFQSITHAVKVSLAVIYLTTINLNLRTCINFLEFIGK